MICTQPIDAECEEGAFKNNVETCTVLAIKITKRLKH
jgi:hypothetical protein